MAKNAVVFAAWMPMIYRSTIYLDALHYYFPDCDFYIGLNPSVPEFEQILISRGFINIAKVDPALEVASDASSYQAALKLLKEKNIEYDTVHFLHTKGVSYKNDLQWMSSCESYFLGYCKRINLVTDALNKDATIGGVSYVGRKEPMNNSGYSLELDKYITAKQTDVENIMSLITFYSIRGSIVKNFLDNCKTQFFHDKMDRYFYETTFPLVVDKYGFKRHYLTMW